MTSKWVPLLILAAALSACGDGTKPPAEAATEPAAADATAADATEAADTGADGADAPAEGKWSQYMETLPFVVGSAAGFEQAANEEKAVMLFLTATW